MKVKYKSIIPIQQCNLCKSRIELKHKDIDTDYLGSSNAVWKCPLCRQVQKVIWEEKFK